MSGKSVAAKIDKAMGKVSKKLGFACQQYRPDNYTDPLDARNLVNESLQVAWSVDEAYVKNPVDELSHYIVYISGATVQPGDIIQSIDQVRTIVITDVEQIRIPSGILADDRMNVYRSMPTPTADIKISLVQIAENVPCAMKIGNGQTTSIASVATSTGTTTLDCWTWMPAEDVQMGDVIEWRGQRFALTTVNSTGKGTKIKATSMKKGS